MKAIRVHEFGGPAVLKVEKDVPIPHYSETQVRLIIFFTRSVVKKWPWRLYKIAAGFEL